jgi:cytochrome c-type biogenesis protein CcmH
MNRIRILTFLLLPPLLAPTARAVENHPPLANPVLERRYQHLTEEIRCLVCQDQNIANSPAPLAANLRYEVRRLLFAGASNAAIKHYLTRRYGDFVLYKPPVQPDTWMLWFGPFALLFAGMTILLLLLRQKSRLYKREHERTPAS